jgi:hypothetical protein
LEAGVSHPWSKPVLLHELGRGALTLTLEPDATERAKVAKGLGLQSLPSLSARLTLKPWMDGVEITGRFEAVVEQICAVSLDAFEQPITGEIDLHAVPEGSPHAPQAAGGEVDYDPEAPDPPDVLSGEAIDVAGYVVEHRRRIRIHPARRGRIAVRRPEEAAGPEALAHCLSAAVVSIAGRGRYRRPESGGTRRRTKAPP